VVSISFSLVAAFIPLLFMGGVVGRLFKEFALTATSTIMISVVVSLTLAPTLAALFMRAPVHHAHDKPGFGERLRSAAEEQPQQNDYRNRHAQQPQNNPTCFTGAIRTCRRKIGFMKRHVTYLAKNCVIHGLL